MKKRDESKLDNEMNWREVYLYVYGQLGKGSSGRQTEDTRCGQIEERGFRWFMFYLLSFSFAFRLSLSLFLSPSLCICYKESVSPILICSFVVWALFSISKKGERNEGLKEEGVMKCIIIVCIQSRESRDHSIVSHSMDMRGSFVRRLKTTLDVLSLSLLTLY